MIDRVGSKKLILDWQRIQSSRKKIGESEVKNERRDEECDEIGSSGGRSPSFWLLNSPALRQALSRERTTSVAK
ncbi:hypothetical protein LguiA_030824 [Lonicera macranthoides]